MVHLIEVALCKGVYTVCCHAANKNSPPEVSLAGCLFAGTRSALKALHILGQRFEYRQLVAVLGVLLQ